MKRVAFILLSLFLLVTGCAPDYDEQEEVIQETKENDKREKAIVAKYSISEDYYRPLEKYKPGKARGVLMHQVANRLDIEEMEIGLRRHSKDVFDPEDYFFQEGQYLTEDMLYNWLERKLTQNQVNELLEGARQELTKEELQKGLNPSLKDDATEEDYRDRPRYLSHILEHNFLQKNEDGTVEVEGISIGLALRSTYRFQPIKYGAYHYEQISQEESLKQGKQLAQTVLERIRKIEALTDVPVMIALYRQEERGSMVPGNFMTKTTVEGSDMTIKEWQPIQEDYVLFPSDEAKDEHRDDSELLADFQAKIAEYFPNYIGVVGKGFYKDDELTKLTIDIPIEFKGKTEVIGISQYVYSLIVEKFPTYFALEVNIESHNGQESLIFREPGDEKPTVHIYGQ